MKITAFRDVLSFRMYDIVRYFGGIYCFLLQVRRISQAMAITMTFAAWRLAPSADPCGLDIEPCLDSRPDCDLRCYTCVTHTLYLLSEEKRGLTRISLSSVLHLHWRQPSLSYHYETTGRFHNNVNTMFARLCCPLDCEYESNHISGGCLQLTQTWQKRWEL